MAKRPRLLKTMDLNRSRETVACNETFGRADALLLGALWTRGTVSFEDRCFRGHEDSELGRARY